MLLSLCWAIFLFPSADPLGNDGWYYAVQVKSLAQTGQVLFQDTSWAYALMAGINTFVGNPTLSPRLTVFLTALLSALLLWLAFARRLPAWKAAAVVVCLGTSPMWLFLHFEFLKNAATLPVFLLGGLLLTRWYRQPHHSVGSFWLGAAGLFLVFLLLVTGHRFSGLLFALSSVLAFLFLLPRLPRAAAWTSAAAAIVVAGLGFTAWLHSGWAERWDSLFVLGSALAERWQAFTAPGLGWLERIWYHLVQWGLPLWAAVNTAAALLRRRAPSVWLLVSAFLVFPFFPWDWDGWSARFFFLAPLTASLHWAAAPGSLRTRSGSAALALGALLSVAGFAEALPLWHRNRQPDYPALREELTGLRDAAWGYRLVVHRGLGGLLGYEQGFLCQNFMPEYEQELYLRLVWKLRREMFEPYAKPGEILPDWSTENYTLIPEPVFQRFLAANPHLEFWNYPYNPVEPLPAAGFPVNWEAAHSLCPATFPTPNGPLQPKDLAPIPQTR